MDFVRYYTDGIVSPFDMVQWENRIVEIREDNGNMIFEQNDVEVPDFWESVATSILANKYFKRARVPSSVIPVPEEGIFQKFYRSIPAEGCEFGREKSLKQVVHRLAGTWTYWMIKSGYIKLEEHADIFYDELCHILINQIAAPNSPQFFNTGLGWAYGIEHADGEYFYFSNKHQKVMNSMEDMEDSICRGASHACVSGDTMVLTDIGWLSVQEIVEKQLIGHNIWDGNGWTDIKAAICNGNQDIYRMQLDNGQWVDLTKDHKVLSMVDEESKWLSAEDAINNYVFFCVKDDDIKYKNYQCNKIAEFVGFHIGDGYYGEYTYEPESPSGNYSQFGVCCATKEETEYYYKIMTSILGKSSIRYKNNISEEYTNIVNYSKNRHKKFAEKYNLGVGSHNVKIPDVIWKSSPSEQCSFLRGLFQADGSVPSHCRNKTSIRLTTVSHQLAHDVQTLLQGLGIYSTVIFNKDFRDNRKGNWHISISTGSERVKFMDRIGFSCNEKNNKLKNMNVNKPGIKKTFPSKNKVIKLSFIKNDKVYDIQTGTGQFAANGIIVHNCHILHIEDSMFGEGSIYETLVSESKIFKTGAGAGANFSALRGKGELLSHGGTSSGVMSFLKIFDRSADAVKSGGTTRRAAKLVSLDIDHPEIEEFIDWKALEEQKVASMLSGSKSNDHILNELIKIWHELGKKASYSHQKIKDLIKLALSHNIEINYIKRAIDLAKQGKSEMQFIKLNNDFNDDAYHTISGQNSNNSICITDNFLNAVKKNLEWNLLNRTDGKIYKTLDARLLWDKLCYSAWLSADPGVHYKDTMNAWNTCLEDGEIHATNPCSEYNFLDSTSCNLSSIRMTRFFDEKSNKFDLKQFRHVIRLMTSVLEMACESALLPTPSLANGVENYRTLGLGYTDIGALMMMQGIPYDSDRTRAWFGALTAILTGEAYLTSVEMAKEKGTFNRYEANKEHMLRVIRNHRRASYNSKPDEYEKMNVIPIGINPDFCPEYLLACAQKTWDKVLSEGEKYGFRNAQATCIAPAGTIGLLMSCDTTGIEPDFSLVKHKKLAGGGYIKIVNRMVPKALSKLGYTEEQIDEISKYIVGNGELPEFGMDEESLLELMSEEQLYNIESSLMFSSNIFQAFNVYTLGKEYCLELGIPEDQLYSMDVGKKILNLMGFTEKEIDQANVYICGNQTIEGAPHVKEEHYPIFDCAVPAGNGTRYIHHTAHIKALASVQSFISGAISKTINVSDDATIEDVENCYWLAHDMGVKCVALYRDGCKLSQPLNTLSKGVEFLTELGQVVDVEEKNIFVAQRRKLPNKRFGQTHEFQIGPFGGPYHKIFLRTGEYDDGNLGEIFIDYAEEDAATRTALGALGRSVSIGLQHGVPQDEYFSMMRSIAQDPSGQVLHPNVKVSKSMYDAIGKMLAYEYGNDDNAVEVPSQERMRAADMKENGSEDSNISHDNSEVVKTAFKVKATLEQCPACGSMDMVKEKSCETKCRRCNFTSGSCGQ